MVEPHGSTSPTRIFCLKHKQSNYLTSSDPFRMHSMRQGVGVLSV